MEMLLKLLQDSKEYRTLLDYTAKGLACAVTGVSQICRSHLIAGLYAHTSTPITVVCQDGLQADALSTALFVMGMEEAADLWRQQGGFEAVFIDAERQIFVTAGLADQITNCEFTVIE